MSEATLCIGVKPNTTGAMAGGLEEVHYSIPSWKRTVCGKQLIPCAAARNPGGWAPSRRAHAATTDLVKRVKLITAAVVL